MTNDPRSYLHKMGLVKEVTKSMEAGHSVPERGSPPMSKPEMKTKLGVSEAKVRVKRPSEYAQADPAMTAKRKTAATANIESNESVKYEKLEKRTLRSLKKGGSEKELRRGHNEFGKPIEKPVDDAPPVGYGRKMPMTKTDRNQRAGQRDLREPYHNRRMAPAAGDMPEIEWRQRHPYKAN